MARILTGIQSTGTPHLGNLLGAIIPAIELSKNKKNESLFFIADLHSFTTIRDAEQLRENTYATAAAWLAFGFDTERNIFYRQSDVTQVCELTWYLNCFSPFQRLQLAHSFKDKSDKISEVNAGLFIYPVLMAADILLYDANIVPVGKDQVQHLEITRDIASRFNHKYPNSFVLPETKVDERVMIVPGTDGRKMSKSYNNFINITNLSILLIFHRSGIGFNAHYLLSEFFIRKKNINKIIIGFTHFLAISSRYNHHPFVYFSFR